MRAAALLPLLLLAACGRDPAHEAALDRLDNELTDNGSATDPEIAAALNGPIMSDAGLGHAANGDAVRPPPRPDLGGVPARTTGEVPDRVDARTLRHAPDAAGACPDCAVHRGSVTLGALAARRYGGCAAGVVYAPGWAMRLPAALPVYPGARVGEAAGNDRAGCRLVVASFSTVASPAKVIDWYYTRARAGGYSAEHQADGGLYVLGGTHGHLAYVVYVASRAGGGSDVDLVTG